MSKKARYVNVNADLSVSCQVLSGPVSSVRHSGSGCDSVTSSVSSPPPEYRGFFCQKVMFILFVLIFTQFFQHNSETLRDVGVPEIRVPHLPSSS